MAEPELRESWFEKPPVHSMPPPSLMPPPPPPPRGARFGLGVLVGAMGSAAGIEVAHLVATRLGAADPLDMASKLGGGALWVGFAVASLAAAPFGGVLAVVMMQGSRFITRALFAAVVSVAIWFCVHIALLARSHTTPPLLPMLVGAAVFGVCVALIPRVARPT
jgi:hypothetical protein